MNEIRDSYSSVADRGQILYFVISELNKMSHMY